MPLGIDFDAIAAAFRNPLARIALDLTRAFERLGRQLVRRTNGLAELERASRVFPVVGFNGDAVRVYVDRAQHRSLSARSTRSAGEAIRGAGSALVAGLGRVGTALEEDLLLPRVFGTLVGIFDMILSSVERFGSATPGMFDARTRTGSDLFGLAGLLFRTFGADIERARALSGSVRAARARLGEALPPAESPATAVPPAPLSDRIVAAAEALMPSFDAGVQAICGALLLLPLLPALFESALRTVGLGIRRRVVDGLAGIVDRVFGARRRIADILADTLPDMLGRGLALIRAAALVVIGQLRFYVRFGVVYTALLTARIDGFLRGVTRFLGFWQTLVELLVGALDAILDFDLMPIFLAMLGPVGSIIAAAGIAPRFTVADLFGVAAGLGRASARAALLAWIGEARRLLWLPSKVSETAAWARRKLGALTDLVGVALRPMSAQLQGEERRPAPLTVRMPNLFDVIFPDGGASLRDALGIIGRGIVDGIAGLLGAGVGLLADAGREFARLAETTARAPMAGRYARVAAGAAREAEIVFGDQVIELRGLSAARADRLALAFEEWLAGAGFELLTSAIPAYIGEMRRYWHAEAEPPPARDAPPTSPHILARRERLGRVRVPRLTVRVAASHGAEGLARTVAQQVKASVEQGYRTGLGRLAPGIGE